MNPRRIAVVTLTLLLAAGTALAQPKKAELEAAKKEAITIADKGVEAYRSEKYQDAIDAFRKADQKFHVPKFLLYVARAQAKLGKLLDAKATYQSIADEKLAQYAPDEFFTSQSDAKKELAELEKRIPAVRIDLSGLPAGQTASVTLDGSVLTAADLGKSLGRDPGPHAIVVTLPGRAPITRNVDLTEGRTESVILEMSAPPLPSAPPLSTPSTSVWSPDGMFTPPAPSVTSLPPGFVAKRNGPNTGALVAMFGAGALGLGVGAIFGGLTMDKYNEFQTKPTVRGADQGEMFALLSDVGFFVGGGATLAGVIYWAVTASRARGSAPATAGIVFVPAASTTGAGASLTGQF